MVFVPPAVGVLGYVLTFGVSFAEAIAFLGMFIPGMTVVITMGGLAAHGRYHLGPLMLLSASGAALGDMMSYEFGRVGKKFLHRRPRVWKHVQKAQRTFQKHGWMAVGLGRFVSPLRGVTPLAAGVLGMERHRFYAAAAFFAVLWGVGSVSFGYFLGSASRTLAPTPHEGEWIFLGLAFAVILFVILRRSLRLPRHKDMER